MNEMRAITPTEQKMLRRAVVESNAMFRRVEAMVLDTEAERYSEWKLDVPEYDDNNGLVIERFDISEQEAYIDKLRAAANPQRGDRSIEPGTYTRLKVDGEVWMTDTPAEIRDHAFADEAMALYPEGSALIVGLGLGMVLNRAIRFHHMSHIDVVEWDQRVLDAVGDHYAALAKENYVDLRFHEADIHAWRPPRGCQWDVGWFDIWATINDDDMEEVTRLRKRFNSRLQWFGAWAQNERIAMKRRINSGKWAY